MRIIQVLHWFLPRHVAGTEVYTHRLSKELQKRHQVWLFCREDGFHDRRFHEEEEIYDDLPVRRIYVNRIGRRFPFPGVNLLQSRNAHIESSFDRFLTEKKPDVVHFQHLAELSGGLIECARKRGLPTVVTLHDYWFLCHRIQLLRPDSSRCSGPAQGWRCAGCAGVGLPYPLAFLLGPLTAPRYVRRTAYLQQCLSMADLIIAPSHFVRDRFVANGFPPDRIRVTDNGTATDWLAEYRPQPSDRLRFGYIGAVMHHKGVHNLVDAFCGLNTTSAELHIFGHADYAPAYYETLKRTARDRHIHFRGGFANREIGQVLSQIDVLFVPSIWHENSPVTIHEARLASIPVVASRIGGIPEFVTDGVSGLLHRPGDIKDLRSQMQRLIDEPLLLARLRHGIQPVKTIEENSLELEAIYERLASGDPP